MEKVDKRLCIGKRALSAQQYEQLKCELKVSTLHHQIILDDLSTFTYLTIDELEKIFDSLCSRLIDKELTLTDFNDSLANHHVIYMLQAPIKEDSEEYLYIDCYRSISRDGVTTLDIIRLLTAKQFAEMSLPNWVHTPFVLGNDPVIALVKGDSLSDKLMKDLDAIKGDLHPLIPVLTGVLSEAQCKKIMDSSIFKGLKSE